MKVRVGSNYMDRGGIVYDVAAIHEHPKFVREDFDYDIAVIKLKGKLAFSDRIQPVNLPDENFPLPEPGTFTIVSGFGQFNKEKKTMSSHLRAVEVPIISREKCKRQYREYLVNESMLCATYTQGGKDACAGDSGGPLTIDDVQIGVVSWGIGCASSKHPGVYASVVTTRDFILKRSGM